MGTGVLEGRQEARYLEDSKGKQMVGMVKLRWAVVMFAIRPLQGAQKSKTVPLALPRQGRSTLVDQVDAVDDGVSGLCIFRTVDSGCHHGAQYHSLDRHYQHSCARLVRCDVSLVPHFLMAVLRSSQSPVTYLGLP